MGEIIKHPLTGEEIYVAVMDDCHYSRDEMLEFKARGFKGFYAGEYDEAAGRRDTLDNLLNDPKTLYHLPRDCAFDPKVDTIMLDNIGIRHRPVTVQKKANRGSAYVWQGLHCNLQNEAQTWAVMIGERANQDGSTRTIFQCDCCEVLFTIIEQDAIQLRLAHPYWAQWIKGNGNAR